MNSQNQQLKSRLHTVLPHVAALLSGDWEPQFNHFYLGRLVEQVPEGAELIVRAYFDPSHRSRVRFQLIGYLPDEARHYGGVAHTEITVDSSRKPEDIAADIERRLLPDYRRELAEAWRYVKARRANRQSLAEAWTDVAQFMPSPDRAPSDEETTMRFYASAATTGRLRLSRDGSMVQKFKVENITVDMAKRIGGLLSSNQSDSATDSHGDRS